MGMLLELLLMLLRLKLLWHLWHLALHDAILAGLARIVCSKALSVVHSCTEMR